MEPLKLWTSILSTLLIILGVLFILASPVGATGARLAVGSILLFLAFLILGIGWILSSSRRSRSYYKPSYEREPKIISQLNQIETSIENQLAQAWGRYKCPVCGENLAGAITMEPGFIRCPYCKSKINIKMLRED